MKLILMFAAALAVAWPGPGPAANRGATVNVTIEGLQFLPSDLTVKVGDTVIWTNNDPFPHTVTASGVLDSQEIPPGKSWKSSPATRGEVTYTCSFHPTMKGTLRIR